MEKVDLSVLIVEAHKLQTIAKLLFIEHLAINELHLTANQANGLSVMIDEIADSILATVSLEVDQDGAEVQHVSR
jgi:hypothetical protein